MSLHHQALRHGRHLRHKRYGRVQQLTRRGRPMLLLQCRASNTPCLTPARPPIPRFSLSLDRIPCQEHGQRESGDCRADGIVVAAVHVRPLLPRVVQAVPAGRWARVRPPKRSFHSVRPLQGQLLLRLCASPRTCLLPCRGSHNCYHATILHAALNESPCRNLVGFSKRADFLYLPSQLLVAVQGLAHSLPCHNSLRTESPRRHIAGITE